MTLPWMWMVIFTLLDLQATGFFVAKFEPGATTFDFLNILPGDVVPNREIQGHHIALDSDLNVIIAGSTRSSDLPVKNAFQPTYAGIIDVFVSKFSNDGELIFSSYLGGAKVDPENNPLDLNGRDYTSGIVIDQDDNIYVAGETDGLGFPVTTGTNLGEWDLFLTKISPTGGLLHSQLIGGPEDDRVDTDDFDQGIAMDSNGLIYIIGMSEEGFPKVGNAYDQK